MVRVLIGYATRAGSTADAAAIIADELRKQGCAVDVADLKTQPSASGYDMVVAGSAIHLQAWLPEALAWLKLRAPELGTARVALFNVCMSAVQAAEDPAKREESLGYNKAAQKTIDASAAESFAGRYAPAKVGFLARLLFKAKQQQPQDYLDPDMIRSWAGSILVGLPF